MAINGDKHRGEKEQQSLPASVSEEAAKIVASPKAETARADIRFVDRPECLETYADSVSQLYFDGQSLRIDYSITRMDEIAQGAPLKGRRFPIQRMVLSPSAAVDLMNRLQRVAAVLMQAGLLKTSAKSSAEN